MQIPEALILWSVPAAFLISGFVFGWLIDRLIVRRLRRLAERTTWQFDGIVLDTIGRYDIFWAALTGAYMAVLTLPITMSPNIERLVHNTLFVLAASTVTMAVAQTLVRMLHLYSDRLEGVLPSTSLFSNLIKLIVILVGAMIILQSLGIAVTPILTALGVGGIAVALALQDTLSNLFSGFQIIASRHVQPGDYVKLGTGEEGYVRDITWRITTIESLSRFMVVVPNNKLATAIVTNFHRPNLEISLLVPVAVSYSSDLDQVETVTIEIAREVMTQVEGGVTEHEPVVRFNGFAESGLTFNVVLRTREFADQYLVKHEFIKRLHRRYRQEGIDIPFPQRTLHLPEGELPVLRVARARETGAEHNNPANGDRSSVHAAAVPGRS